MQLFKTKIWSWVDIVLLKWCVLFFGMIVGACIPDFDLFQGLTNTSGS